MKEERTAGPLHSAHSMQLHSPHHRHAAFSPLLVPPPSFFALILLLFTLSWRLLWGDGVGGGGAFTTFRQGIISALCVLSGPGWPIWGAAVQSSASLSCLLPRLHASPRLSAPLRACHLTAHSVPHWLVLSITIYLLLEWQQPLHLTSLFHQLWIDYWMWTSARACCWTHLLAGIR